MQLQRAIAMSLQAHQASEGWRTCVDSCHEILGKHKFLQWMEIVEVYTSFFNTFGASPFYDAPQIRMIQLSAILVTRQLTTTPSTTLLFSKHRQRLLARQPIYSSTFSRRPLLFLAQAAFRTRQSNLEFTQTRLPATSLPSSYRPLCSRQPQVQPWEL